MEIKLLSENDFFEFTSKFLPSSVYQTINYGNVMKKHEYDCLYLGYIEGGYMKAASLILVYKVNGFKYALAPRGFLIDYNNEKLLINFTKVLKKFLGKRDIVAVKVNPMIIRKVYDHKGRVIFNNNDFSVTYDRLIKNGYFHLGYNNYFEALKPRFESYINLNLNFIKLFGNMDKSTRNKIRKAVRDGIKIYHGEKEDLKYLYMQTKKKYPRDLEYFNDLYDSYNKNNMIDFYYSKLDTTDYLKHIQNMHSKYTKESHELNTMLIDSKKNPDRVINKKLSADKEVVKYKNKLAKATEYLKKYPNGIIISTALVVKWQDEVHIIMDGYDDDFKNFGAKQLLIWKLIGRYAKLGFKRLNLGGVSNINEENSKYKGLNEFKMNFHSKVVEYIGDFELVTNSPLYFMYKNSFGITGIFGKK
ncbi:MAG: peptidoglycan bridge formation glycyltransferase FemA/FemB family protein [Bacilli bacterium]|nr:peptidoglycan bridge formation glycyltransferase FemA/FemB family protein [Bacilli bacterium]